MSLKKNIENSSLSDKVKQLLANKLVRYLLIGGLSTLVHIIAGSTYVYLVDHSTLHSNIAGFLVAYVFSYLLQSTQVFKSKVSIVKAVKYFIVQASALLTAAVLTGHSGVPNSYLKVLIVAVSMPFITFFIHTIWTFKNDTKAS